MDRRLLSPVPGSGWEGAVRALPVQGFHPWLRTVALPGRDRPVPDSRSALGQGFPSIWITLVQAQR